MTADAETRAEALAAVRGVLAALKARAAGPPRAAAYPKAVPWDTPPASTPPADFEAVAKEWADPTPGVLQLLERLTYLLGLSDLEREFFEACASDEMMNAFDGRLAYADWLEERSDGEGALRLRKLTPQPGDVLVWTLDVVTGSEPETREAYQAAAEHSRETLAGRGVETSYVLLQRGVTLDRLSAQQMAELGLVPAGRLARVRERCAALAEQGHYYHLAASIRADPSLEEMQWAEVSAPGDNAG